MKRVLTKNNFIAIAVLTCGLIFMPVKSQAQQTPVSNFSAKHVTLLLSNGNVEWIQQNPGSDLLVFNAAPVGTSSTGDRIIFYSSITNNGQPGPGTTFYTHNLVAGSKASFYLPLDMLTPQCAAIFANIQLSNKILKTLTSSPGESYPSIRLDIFNAAGTSTLLAGQVYSYVTITSATKIRCGVGT